MKTLEGYVNRTSNPILDVAIDDGIDSSGCRIAPICKRAAAAEVRKDGEVVIICAKNDTVKIGLYE